MLGKPKPYSGIIDIFSDFALLDLRRPSTQEMVLMRCYNFLIDKIQNEEDYMLFIIDIKFDKSGDLLQIKGCNLISSLWLIGVYPKYPNKLKDSLTYSFNKIDYIYNPKNKKLTILKQQ